MSTVIQLIEKEGWLIHKVDGEEKVRAFGQFFPVVHPFAIYAKLCRNEKVPEQKYRYMKAMHDYLWPGTVWHYWTERRFRAHCENYNYISFAGGTSTSKSYDTAKIGILWWLCDPHHRGIVIASTSLDSLNSRIWGYVLRALATTSVPIGYDYQSSKPPKILNLVKDGNKKNRDFQHGLFAIAAKQGDDEATISSWIGRHPDKGLMLILDEGTDMPPALTGALPNLEGNQPWFQCIIIGNSNSRFDLHGAMSTPKVGWDKIDPMVDFQWETTQKNGICLFFNCYDSPAIHETDPVRKEKLSKFLITAEKIAEKEKQYGKDSDDFWRMVIGFWKKDTSNDVVISEQFLSASMVKERAEWSGLYPLSFVAGLDPAFSTGGDKCILRLAILGVDTRGFVVLDYRSTQLLFPIPIVATSEDDASVQIAKEVIKVMQTHGCSLSHLGVDANGQGRALAPLIQYVAKDASQPIKFYSAAQGNVKVRSFDVQIRTPLEMWAAFREFMMHGQIRGMDDTSLMQLSTRLVLKSGTKQTLESKKEYRTRMGAIMPSLAHSPDEADAAALVLQTAILKFGFSPGQRRTIQQSSTFEGEKLRVFKEQEKQAQQMNQSQNSSGLSFAPPKMNFKGGLLAVARIRNR